MTQNVYDTFASFWWAFGSAAIILLFGLGLTIPPAPGRLPGSSGHADDAGQGAGGAGGTGEVVRADGYIDSFANNIEEAGGGLPWFVTVSVVGILLWWALYLVLFWAPR